jgi:hypothetical protein
MWNISEKLIVAPLLEKFPIFYDTQNFITAILSLSKYGIWSHVDIFVLLLLHSS